MKYLEFVLDAGLHNMFHYQPQPLLDLRLGTRAELIDKRALKEASEALQEYLSLRQRRDIIP